MAFESQNDSNQYLNSQEETTDKLLVNAEDDSDASDGSPDGIYLNKFDPAKINISVIQPTIYNLVQRMSSDPPEIDLNTSFQRNGELWDKTRQSRLIESMLLRIPLPTFYFDGSDDECWLVVDGLQRLNAMKAFIIDQSLKLTNLEYFGEFTGLKFSELPRNMMRRLEETQIIANVIQPGTPDEVKFTIFKRINTGGFYLNAQEIRHAIFHGIPSNFIEKLANLHSFQYFHINSKRMLDQELVTRFVAFYILKPENYRERMDDFLESVMSHLRNEDKAYLERICYDFDKAMWRARIFFGGKAFKRILLTESGNGTNRINKAMFDVWSVQLSRMNDNDFTKVKDSSFFTQKYDELLKNEKFINAVSQGTGHKESVILRFFLVDQLIKECLQ